MGVCIKVIVFHLFKFCHGLCKLCNTVPSSDSSVRSKQGLGENYKYSEREKETAQDCCQK